MKFDPESRRPLIFFCVITALAVLWLWDGNLLLAVKSDSAAGDAVARFGYWLGNGLVLASLTVAIALIGRIADRPNLFRAGIEGLVAFALSGAAAQLVKHIIGRPRPRLWLEGVSHFGPTFESGLDSFPSGHTASTIAVALVLSLRYPRLAPVLMIAAAFTSVSRILGGSHFPLDVLGGVILGFYSAKWAVRLSAFSRKGRQS